jgi:hypothetical protein
MNMKNNLLIPLLILAVVALGCSSLREMAGSNSPPAANQENQPAETAPLDEPSSPATAYSPSGDPRADIEKLGQRFLSAKSFRARMESIGGGPVTSEVDFVAPDRFHLRTATPAGEEVDVIIIGKTTYMKADDKWQKVPMDIGSMIPNFRDAFNREGMKGMKDVKFEGEDIAEGKAAYRYSYIGQAPQGGVEFSSKLWIAKDTGYPVKIVADYKTGEMKSMTIVYDYETPLSIEPPVEN